ncbi:hypothetical protein ABW19_dt0200502 [Dactylella cylindrospora]|nr:hypothetical protein ABW19_dt0200502 [Dactylella cylindrospora]
MSREHLVVAVDFGTTFTGIAYCQRSQKDLRDIEVVSQWPGNAIAPKTPTEIRYLDGRDPLWGAEASLSVDRRHAGNPTPIYNRFKLLLDPTIQAQVYGNSSIPSSFNSDIKLPPGKTAMDVAADYLKLLYEEFMNNILKKRMPETLYSTPIHFVFTIPAIWNHRAQEATRYAAKKAGFCSRPGDTFSLVSEPEAAAMFVLQAMNENNFSRISTQGMSSLQIGENFVICDAGGGTVDLISYQVVEAVPSLRLKETAVGTGAKCGSSYIDEAFLRLLRSKIGSDFEKRDKWGPRQIGRGSALMKSFDNIKKSFGQTTNDIWFLDLPVPVQDNEAVGIIDNELELTANDLKALFDPIVDQIVGLVSEQVETIRSRAGDNLLSTIFLVGGFGESQYLYQRLVKWANKRNPPLTVVNPTKSWSAIMRGAIIHTMRPAVTSRRLRQHYGFRCGLPFNPITHDIADAYECPFGGWYLRGSVEWTANMGDECGNDKEIEFPIFTVLDEYMDLGEPYIISLYGCKKPTAPIFKRDGGVYKIGKIKVDLSSVNLNTLQSVQKQVGSYRTKKFRLHSTVKMRIGSADASFSVWRDGKCVGTTRISYELEDKGSAYDMASLGAGIIDED